MLMKNGTKNPPIGRGTGPIPRPGPGLTGGLPVRRAPLKSLRAVFSDPSAGRIASPPVVLLRPRAYSHQLW